jgi:hypothetical protein
LLGGHFALERAKARQPKTVFVCHGLNLLDLGEGDLAAECKTFQPSLQRQRHGFRHAGIHHARRKPEVKMEIDLAGNAHHAPVDHQDIIPRRRHSGRHVAGPGHIAYHRARP